MNAVEIEEAISALAEQPFDAAEFPYAFLLNCLCIELLKDNPDWGTAARRHDMNQFCQDNHVLKIEWTKLDGLAAYEFIW